MSHLTEQFKILSELANNSNLEQETHSLINFTVRTLIQREFGIDKASVEEHIPVIGFTNNSTNQESEDEE